MGTFCHPCGRRGLSDRIRTHSCINRYLRSIVFPAHKIPCLGAANTHAPKFVRLIRAKYKFEEVQTLVIKLFDIDSSMHSRAAEVDLQSQDYIGEITCQFAQIMGSRGSMFRGTITNTVHHSRARGAITVRGEEIKNCNAKLSIQLAAEKLENKVGLFARLFVCVSLFVCVFVFFLCVCFLVCSFDRVFVCVCLSVCVFACLACLRVCSIGLI